MIVRKTSISSVALVGFMLIASSCGTLEDTITGGAEGSETTQPETTTAPAVAETVAPTTVPPQGFVSEGNGLTAPELRQMLAAIGETNGDAGSLKAFNYSVPVEVPDTGTLTEFEINISEGFELSESRRTVDLSYQYPIDDLRLSDAEKYFAQIEKDTGWEADPDDSESYAAATFDIDQPVPDSRLSLFVSEREYSETSSLRVGTRTPSGDPKLVGNPEVFSSWFDGVIPIPSDGAFVGGGGVWAGDDGASLEEPGETLNATFEYLKRTEIELKDEARMLAESYDLEVSEERGNLVLEGDQFKATYNFDSADTVRVRAHFK